MRIILLCSLLLAPFANAAAPRKLAVTRVFGSPGQVGLFIAAADGSGERPLLEGSKNSDYDPVWAPDGSSIVFTSDRTGSAELFRTKPDGTGLEQLTQDPAYDDQAAFSPDGKQLVFVSTRDGGIATLWTLDLATRRVKRLTTGKDGDFRPSWSPGGQWIAFSSSRNHPSPFAHGRWERLQLADIYIVHPDGSGLKKLSGEGFCGSPKWMADNTHIVAYCMTGEQTLANRRPAPDPGNDTKLVSIDITTGASTTLKAGPGSNMNPAPLPGNEVGYVKKDTAGQGSGIYYLSGKLGPRGNIRAASWSPDGKQVVFHKRLTVPRAELEKTFTASQNYELSLAGRSLPAFDPAGNRMVGSGPGSNSLGASIMITTTATGRAEVIFQHKTRNVLAPQWSPQGDKLVFGIGAFGAFFQGFHELFLKPADRVEGGAQVAMVNADGTGFQELTSGSANNAFPTFAPDGRSIVYREFNQDSFGLRIMNLETKAITKLTSAYDNFPLWSPRGDVILFSRLVDDAYELHTIKSDGTGLKRLTFTHGNDAHMSWSPDGELIAFASSRMGFKDEAAYTDAPQPYGDLFVMRYDGTHVEQLTDNQWEEGTSAWQPQSIDRR